MSVSIDVTKGKATHTLLGINLANISCLQLILAQLGLFLHALLIALCEGDELFHLVDIVMTFLVEVVHLQSLSPHMLVQVHQHVFLQPCLSVINCNAVVVTVQTVNQSLDRGFVQVAQVGCRLTRFLAHDDSLRLDETEGVNDNLALHGLDRIDDNGNGTRGQLLE